MALPEVPVRKLGSQGLQAAAMGLGCMGMSAFYKDTTGSHSGEQESIATIHRAKELGVTFLGEKIGLLYIYWSLACPFQRAEVVSEQFNACCMQHAALVHRQAHATACVRTLHNCGSCSKRRF
jgi:hypothetical protein